VALWFARSRLLLGLAEMTTAIGWARPSTALAVASAVMPPLTTIAPLGLTIVLPVAAVAALALGGYRDLPRLRSLLPLLAMLAIAGALGLASALWSIVPEHSLATALRFIGLALCGLALCAVALGLEAPERERVRRALLLGVLVALLILAVAAAARLVLPAPEEGEFASWLRHYTRFNRGTTTLALAIWPAVLALGGAGRPARAVLLLAGAFLVLLGLADQSAKIAVGLGIAVWTVARYFPRLSAAAMGAGLAALVVLLPLAPLAPPQIVRIHEAVPAMKISGLHRLAIWHFASERIAERPLLGWGLDASRAIPGGSDRIADPDLRGLLASGALWMPLHPHSAALQWRLELGWPGVAILTLLVWWCLRRASTAPTPAQRSTALALTASALVVAMLSYGFWQEWWQSSLWLVAAASLTVLRPEAGDRRSA